MQLLENNQWPVLIPMCLRQQSNRKKVSSIHVAFICDSDYSSWYRYKPSPNLAHALQKAISSPAATGSWPIFADTVPVASRCAYISSAKTVNHDHLYLKRCMTNQPCIYEHITVLKNRNRSQTC